LEPFFAGEGDVYAGGHEYVREEGFGGELFNFKPFEGELRPKVGDGMKG
jgi:hypothetical protein